eukprot:1467495-Alexandrium_andersonii.AAC.1
MAPGRAGSSPARPASVGGAGEWQQAQGRRAAGRTQRPQKSAGAGSEASSGFTRQGAQSKPFP